MNILTISKQTTRDTISTMNQLQKQSFKILLVSIALFFASSAQAIPPPDILASVWQSALQMLGIASVFIASAYFSVKQFFSVYFLKWSNIFWVLAAIILLPFVLWFAYVSYNSIDTRVLTDRNHNNVPISNNQNNNNIPNNPSSNSETGVKFVPSAAIEHITIEETIARDPDEEIREWKLKTFKEMQEEANQARSLKSRPPLSYQTLPSFKPQTLYAEMQKDRNKFYLLDVREAYERSRFFLPFDASIRYGDVLNDLIVNSLEKPLPTDRQIIVLCHSGLRGYITANMLTTLTGNKNIAYLQGGLRAWDQQKLPIEGDEEYSSEPVKKMIYTAKMIKKAKNVLKVNIETKKTTVPQFKDVIHLAFETATSKDVDIIIERSKTKPIIIICSSFIACFHSNSFSYLVEKKGGKVIGIHDTTGEFVIPPIIYDD